MTRMLYILTWPAALFIAGVLLWYGKCNTTGNPGSVWLFTVLSDWLGIHGYEKPFRLLVASMEIVPFRAGRASRHPDRRRGHGAWHHERGDLLPCGEPALTSTPITTGLPCSRKPARSGCALPSCGRSAGGCGGSGAAGIGWRFPVGSAAGRVRQGGCSRAGARDSPRIRSSSWCDRTPAAHTTSVPRCGCACSAHAIGRAQRTKQRAMGYNRHSQRPFQTTVDTGHGAPAQIGKLSAPGGVKSPSHPIGEPA